MSLETAPEDESPESLQALELLHKIAWDQGFRRGMERAAKLVCPELCGKDAPWAKDRFGYRVFGYHVCEANLMCPCTASPIWRELEKEKA